MENLANIHLPIRYSTECHQLCFEAAADQTEGLHVLHQQIWRNGRKGGNQIATTDQHKKK